jgi:hypothetical protein
MLTKPSLALIITCIIFEYEDVTKENGALNS